MPPKAKATDNSEELASMAQVRELLEQQKASYISLLEQQEKTVKSCVEIFVDSSNERVGELMREVHDLKVLKRLSRANC